MRSVRTEAGARMQANGRYGRTLARDTPNCG